MSKTILELQILECNKQILKLKLDICKKNLIELEQQNIANRQKKDNLYELQLQKELHNLNLKTNPQEQSSLKVQSQKSCFELDSTLKKSKIKNASIFFLTPQNRVLIIKLAYSPYKWTIPGGKIERYHTPWLTAKKEFQEETGFTLDETHITNCNIYDYMHDNHDITAQGDITRIFIINSIQEFQKYKDLRKLNGATHKGETNDLHYIQLNELKNFIIQQKIDPTKHLGVLYKSINNAFMNYLIKSTTELINKKKI